MRNIVAHIPPKSKERFAARLKQIWLQESKKEAMMIAQAIIQEFGQRYPEAIDVLEAGLEDSLQFYHFPQIDKRKISSTNVLEEPVSWLNP